MIADAIHNFYKPPKKYNRGDAGAEEYGEEAPVSFDKGARSVAASTTMFSGKAQNQS